MFDHEVQTIEAEGDLEVMSAGECLSDVEPSKMLLGDLWREGELAVLYGDTSSGKSLLAVQLAEAIARGRSIEPFEMTAGAQKVLLLDLGRTREQFSRRYMAESDSDEVAGKRYEFSPDLKRGFLKNAVQIAPGKLGPAIERSGAKIVIIDSLAYLQKYAIPRETVVAMRELRRLQKRFGLSILVLMNTSRVVNKRGISAGDIPCSSVVTSYADNVFAVGRSGSKSAVRYLKHIKNSLDDTIYGAAHVPYFAIIAEGGVFPSFHYIGVAGEMTLRSHDNDHWEWQRIRSIKRLSDEGKTIREIAAELEIARSTVQRLLAMAGDAPPLPSPSAFVEEKIQHFVGREACIVRDCKGCHECSGRAARDFSEIPANIIKGHGGECPDDCDMCGPRRYDPEDETVDSEVKDRSAAHYEALREWLLDGKRGPKPVYPEAHRYGVEKACWKPGSEKWTEEQVAIFDRWMRTHPKIGPEPDFNPRAGP
ncbi:MAG: AAA family ATPase [Pyrinomonadaceae bacterium]